jgi:hypothetical protein
MTSIFGGINQSDEQILRFIYREAVATGANRISLSDIYTEVRLLCPSEEKLIESVCLLKYYGYLDMEYDSNEACVFAVINSRCFEEYARDYRTDYYDLYIAVPEKIVNENLFRSEDIAKALKMPTKAINLILDYFMQNGFINANISEESNIHIYGVCQPFRRLFKKK